MSDLHRIAALRELLDQPPSATIWTALIEYLQAYEVAPDLDVDLAYVETHISHWPDALKIVPHSMRHEWLTPRPKAPLYFRLCRSITLSTDVFTASAAPSTPMALRPMQLLLHHRSLPFITHLAFWKCNIQPEDLEALAKCKGLSQLKSLTLNSQWFDVRSIQAILSSPHLANLEILDLSQSFLKDKYAMILAQTGHPNVRRLILDDTQVDIRGARSILDSLMWPSLEHLSLRGNRFGEVSPGDLHGFQDPFASPTPLSLTTLNLGNNWLHPNQGDALIERGFIDNLTTLDVERSDFAASFCHAVTQRHLEQPFVELNLRHIQQIDLEDAHQLIANSEGMESLRLSWPLPGYDLDIDEFTLARWPLAPTTPDYDARPSQPPQHRPGWLVPKLTYAGDVITTEEANAHCAWGYNIQDGLFVLAEGTGEHDAGATYAQCLIGGLVAWAQATGVKGEHWQLTPSYHIDEWRPWRMDLGQVDTAEPFAHPIQWLLYRLVHLAQLLLDLQGEAIEYVGAQTSLLATQLWHQHIGFVHVGNDGAYRIRDGQIECITDRMHLDEITRRAGAIPDNTYMMSLNERSFQPALGNPQTRTVTVQLEQTQPGDTYIMCSRSAFEAYTPAEILAAFRDPEAVTRSTCRELLRRITEREHMPNAAITAFHVKPDTPIRTSYVGL